MIKKNTNTPKSRTRSNVKQRKKMVTNIIFYFWSVWFFFFFFNNHVWLFNYTCDHFLGIWASTKKLLGLERKRDKENGKESPM